MFFASTCRFRTTLSALVLSLSAALPAAHGQNLSNTVVANVPFGFDCGSVHLIAGRYTLQTNPSNPFVILNGPDKMITILKVADQARDPASSGKFVFRHYGGHYFLREVRFADTPMYLNFKESPIEKQERIAANVAKTPLQEVAGVQNPH